MPPNILYYAIPGFVVLLSLEIAATLLLFGAQVISEYERLGHASVALAEPGFTTAPL